MVALRAEQIDGDNLLKGRRHLRVERKLQEIVERTRGHVHEAAERSAEDKLMSGEGRNEDGAVSVWSWWR